MQGRINRSFLFVFISLAISYCGEKQERKATAGKRDDSQQTPIGGGDAVNGGAAMTLQQCNSQGKAWVAVVNNGSSPPTCGGQLASWGCCEAQVLARFPSLASDLQQRLQANAGEGYTLYNCEANPGTKQAKLHFVKFPGGGRTEYRNLDINAFMMEPGANVEQCPQVPTIPNMPADGSSGSSTSSSASSSATSSSGGAVALNFATDVNPILVASCSNGNCHKAGDAYSPFVGNEAEFKKAATDSRLRICRTASTPGAMPPAGPLGDNEKSKLIKYIDQVNGIANSTGLCP